MHKHEFTHLVANKQFINARVGPCAERCSHGYQRTDERDSNLPEIATGNQWNGTCCFWHLRWSRFFYFQLKRFHISLAWQKHPNLTVSGGFPHQTFMNTGLFGCVSFLWNEALEHFFSRHNCSELLLFLWNVSNIHIKQYSKVLTLHTPTVYSVISQILEIFDKEHAYISFAGPQRICKGNFVYARIM